jgi:hypothetical protein
MKRNELKGTYQCGMKDEEVGRSSCGAGVKIFDTTPKTKMSL